MRLTKKNSPKSYTIYYLPQEIKETMVTEVSYLPITRERDWNSSLKMQQVSESLN